jgi:hypothetical protein
VASEPSNIFGSQKVSATRRPPDSLLMSRATSAAVARCQWRSVKAIARPLGRRANQVQTAGSGHQPQSTAR